MGDTRIWADLAQECEAKGIEVKQNDDADALRKKLSPKTKTKEEE